ncbi:nitronate monooxygenase [Rhizobium sp. ICMP 5592]|uniref:NAD(P)H-dependent flavin oxidoreductase n=1 Tax=Rhizobium sp. ICMP 5592 TaxID=2292445 RepID=UPI001295A72A|nr:nitronate monooxygenase [Rhizobium sp. ICMP 5592]MQB46105.1 nitronate monooxygenase [Rhizobium sp. ICMP 5592]
MTNALLSVRARVDALKDRMRLPVIVAPMFLVSGPDLVVAASRSGVIGSFPAPNARTIADLRQWLETISTSLDRARAKGESPAGWAFNMITHTTYGRFDEELDLVSEFKPEIVISALGGPHRIVDPVHGYGGLVFADVNAPLYAKKAIDKGADGLVLVTSGAGGHTGEYSMLAFIDEVRSFWDGPLAVGGAISRGASIRVVENLGVDFAYMGTRFIPTPESLVSREYKQMTVDSSMSDLVASRALTGALGNWMKASVVQAGLSLDEMKAEAKIDFSTNFHDVKAWKTVWSAGHGVGVITDVEPVSQIVDRLANEYLEAVSQERKNTRFEQKLARLEKGRGLSCQVG